MSTCSSRVSSSTSSSSMTGLGAREATEGTEGARRGGILIVGGSSREELRDESDDSRLNNSGDQHPRERIHPPLRIQPQGLR